MTQNAQTPNARVLTPKQERLLDAVETYAADKDQLLERVLASEAALSMAIQIARHSEDGNILLDYLGDTAHKISVLHQSIFAAYKLEDNA